MITNDETAHYAVFQPPFVFFILGSKIPPQNAVLEISQFAFVPYCDKPNFIPT